MKKKEGGSHHAPGKGRCTEKLVKHPIISVIQHVTKIYVYNSTFLVNILQVL